MKSERKRPVGSRVGLSAVVVPWIFGSFSLAQCVGTWDAGLLAPAGSGFDTGAGAINAAASYDDGTGSKLYVTGGFRYMGGSAVNSVTGLDGDRWQTLGEGLTFGIHHSSGGFGMAMMVYDFDGAGPEASRLVVGGFFGHAGMPEDIDDGWSDTPRQNIAAWNGSTWMKMNGFPSTQVYSNDQYFGLGGVNAFVAFDDGAGTKLYAGGQSYGMWHQDLAGNFRNVAVWNGARWSPLPIFPDGTDQYPFVMDMCVHNDGTGDAMYIGGRFGDVPGVVNTNNILKWDGDVVSSVASGRPGKVIDRILSFDADGAGGQPSKLYAFGGGVMSRLDGTTWTEFPIPGAVPESWPPRQLYRAACVFNDGTGEAIYMHSAASDGGSLYKFNGTGFTLVPTTPSVLPSVARSLSVVNLGTGPTLAVTLGGGSRGVYLLKNGLWVPPDTAGSIRQSMLTAAGMATGSFSTITTFDADGTGSQPPALYVTATGQDSADAPVNTVLKFNGTTWTSTGTLSDIPGGLHQKVGAGGPELYMSNSASTSGMDDFSEYTYGRNTILYKLTPGGWQLLDAYSSEMITGGIGKTYSTFAAGNVGGTGELFRGTFWQPWLAEPFPNGIGRWNGTGWSAVLGGLMEPQGIYSLQILDSSLLNEGTGSALYAYGNFSVSGAPAAAMWAKWDGAAWTDAPRFNEFNQGNPYAGVFSINVFNGAVHVLATDYITGYPYPYSLFRFDTTTSAWVQQTIPQPSPESEENFSFQIVGVGDNGDGQRMFGLLFDASKSIYAHEAYEFDGEAWTSIGWFRGGLGAPVRFDSGGQRALWFTGTLGVDGDRAGNLSSIAMSAMYSPGIARRWCPIPCAADFNTSGAVTVQDIFDFLAAWFAGSPSADINHTGGVTVQDIFDFLALWFAGC